MIALDDALAPPRNPDNLRLRRRQVDYARQLLADLPDEATAIEILRLRQHVVKASRLSVGIYPTSAALRADLAQASADIGMFPDAVREGEAALKLDGLTPHQDKKLSKEQRSFLESQIKQWGGEGQGPDPQGRGPQEMIEARRLNTGDLYRQARRAASWGIAVSLGLGLAKLVGGLVGGSLALVSDAAHSLVDAVISSALVGALLVAQKPADDQHPYGHARFEAVAGAGVAMVLILLAIEIAREAISSVGGHREPPAAFTLAIALAGAGFQEALFHYARAVAKKTGSAALMATAWDYRLDAIGGLAVVAGVALARWGGPGWAWADHAAAIVIAGAVFWIGGNLLWGNIQDLMDRQADPSVLKTVHDESMDVLGVLRRREAEGPQGRARISRRHPRRGRPRPHRPPRPRHRPRRQGPPDQPGPADPRRPRPHRALARQVDFGLTISPCRARRPGPSSLASVRPPDRQ